MDIESIKKIKLEKGEALFVEVDFNGMPRHAINQMSEQLRNDLANVFGPEVKILIAPLNKIRISAVNVEDAIIKEVV